MKHDPVGHPEPTLAPVDREREMDLPVQDIGQAVERERALVREHAGAIGPQPDDSQLLMLTRGEVDEAVDASPDSDDTPPHGGCARAGAGPNHRRLPPAAS